MKRIKGITYRRCELYAGLVNVIPLRNGQKSGSIF